jgi:hypothetical protein
MLGAAAHAVLLGHSSCVSSAAADDDDALLLATAGEFKLRQGKQLPAILHL